MRTARASPINTYRIKNIDYNKIENGEININDDEEYYVYPVISLRTDTLVVGSGTEADPYVVQTR